MPLDLSVNKINKEHANVHDMVDDNTMKNTFIFFSLRELFKQNIIKNFYDTVEFLSSASEAKTLVEDNVPASTGTTQVPE